MSFKIVEQAKPRLNRSELAVPGSSPDFFEKAAKSDTDVIFLDLEDSVAPDDKEKARENVIKALNEIDFGKKIISNWMLRTPFPAKKRPGDEAHKKWHAGRAKMTHK